ncbi:MAG: cytochrome b [Pseudomonadota bacterium]
MALVNSRERWGSVAKGLHWLMAFLLVGMFVGGMVMTDWPQSDLQTKFQLYQLHKSFGFVVVALLLLRIVWRLLNPVPPLPANSSWLTRRASAISHGTLYALMVLVPLTGYLMTSTSTLGLPTVAFGIVPIPHVLGPSATWEAIFKLSHDVLGKVLMVVVVIHVVAALKHALLNRDGIFSRMWFGRQTA